MATSIEEIIIRVYGEDALRALKGVEKGVDGLKKKTEEGSKGFSKFQASIVTLNQTLDLSQRIFSGAASAISGIAAGIEKGSGIDDLQSSFKQLAAQAGVSADVLQSKFNAAISGTLTNVEQAAKMNKLFLAGLDPKEFETIGKAARVLGEQLGTDLGSAIDTLSSAIASGRVMSLKQVGWIVDDQKALFDYAKAHGVAADKIKEHVASMGDQERGLALQSAILAEAKRQIGNYGDVSVDAGDSVVQFKVQLENLRNEFWKNVATNAAVQSGLSDLNTTLKTVDFTPLINGFTSIISFGVSATSVIAEMITKVERMKVAMAVGFGNVGAVANYQQQMQNAANSIKDINQELTKGTKDSTLKAIASFNALAKSVSSLGSGHPVFDEFNDDLGKLQTEVMKAAEAQGVLGKANDKLVTGENTLLKGMLARVEAATKLAKETDAATDAEVKRTKSLTESAQKEKQQTEELIKAQKAVRNLIDSRSGIGIFQAQIDKLFYDDSLGQSPLIDSFNKIIAEAQAAGEEVGQLVSYINQLKGQEVTIPINVGSENPADIFRKDGEKSIKAADLNSISQGFSDMFGEELGPDMEQVGAAAISSLADGMRNADNGDDWKMIASDIGGQLGEALGTHLGGPIGGAVGSILGEQLTTAVFSAFQSSNPGKEERKIVDQYFADLLGQTNLVTIVQGQLKVIEDMTFSNYSSTILNGLVEPVKGAFIAIGAGYEEILKAAGVSTENISGQMAAILANNIGGSISDLRLLLEATGQTAESMGNALMKAFLQGKYTAIDFMNAMRAIEQTAQRGIPEAFGAVDQAWDRVIQAGYSGGAALLDALASVAVEAQELGASTFPQLADIMVNTFGYSAQSVANFMQAMAVAGVNSLAELAAASNETLAAVAANMQALETGQAANYTPIEIPKANFSTPSIGGGGSSSAANKAEEAARKKEQKRTERRQKLIASYTSEQNALNSLVTSSEAYQEIMDKLYLGEIQQAEAVDSYNKMVSDALPLIKRQIELEATREDLISKIARGKKVKKNQEELAAIEFELSKIAEQIDRFGELPEKIEDIADEIEEVAIATKPVTSMMDAIFNLGAKGALSGGDSVKEFLEAFKGNVNELAVSVDALGGSFKSMQDQALNSFLNGSMSAVEAQNLIADMGQGIAEIKGGIFEAFQAFQDYGIKGGRFTVDALKDIAAEAMEAGAGSFDGIINVLRNNGVSESVIQQFFLQMEEQGIDTLEALKTVSDDTALNIIANLDKAKFPFKETSKDISDLLAQLDSLTREEKKVKVVLDVSSVFADSQTKNIASYVVPSGSSRSAYGLSGDTVGLK